MNKAAILQRAKEVLNIEAEGIVSLVDRLDEASASHHRAVEEAFGTSRADRLMRELNALIAALGKA